MLYYITAIAVLPTTYSGVPLDGKLSAVVVLDTDGRFDVRRLAHVMRSHILQRKDSYNTTVKSTLQSNNDTAQSTETAASVQLSEDAVENLIKISLQHIYIFRPQSFASQLATLSTLPSYLLSSTAHKSSHRPLHSILIDSVSAFYWQSLPSTTATDSNANSKPSPSPYATLTSRLRTLQSQFHCPVITTSWSVGARPHLPSLWQNFVTVRLVVGRKAVPPFPPGFSVEEAGREREQRQSVVRKGEFIGWINGAGGPGREFVFWIGEAGVRFDGE